MRTSLRLFVCLLSAIELGTASATEVFSFWPGEGADQAAGFQDRHGHPCGETVTAKVSKLPTASNGPFISEVVVELNARDKVIRRWPMPVDYVPQALRGDELLVAAGEKGFWVRPSGAFSKTSAIPPDNDSHVSVRHHEHLRQFHVRRLPGFRRPDFS